MRRLAAATIALILASTAGTAAAAPPSQVAALCSGAKSGCSLTFDPWMREAATYPVALRGTPGARVQVVVYAATMVDGQPTRLTPVSAPRETFVSGPGVENATVVIPALPDAVPGGWGLVSLAGVTPSNLAEAIGGWVPLGSRTPTLLGDGYGELKPAGQTLELHLVGTIPGSVFAVDYADASGTWHDVTAADAGNVPAARPDQEAVVRYTMPRGLAPTPHEFRLRNVTAGVPVATWKATPDLKGQAKPREQWQRPAAIGELVEGANQPAAHPTWTVKAVAAGVGGASIVAVLIGYPIARRRGGFA